MSKLIITWRFKNGDEHSATGTYHGYSALSKTLMFLIDNDDASKYIQYVFPDNLVSIKPVSDEPPAEPTTREQFKSLPAGTVFTLVQEVEDIGPKCETLFKPDDEFVYMATSKSEFVPIYQDSESWDDWEVLSIYSMITPL